MTNKKLTILLDFNVNTSRRVCANRPDINVKRKKKKHWNIIDISYLFVNDVAIKTPETSKYKTFEIKIEDMRNIKTIVIPVVEDTFDLIITRPLGLRIW